MKRLLAILAAVAVVVAAGIVATSKLGDRALLTPPPDAVAEGFFRDIATHRFDRAKTYLARLDSASVEDLRRLGASVEGTIGRVHDVRATTIAATDTKALVTARLKSDSGSEVISVALEFSSGEWKLVQSANAGSR